MEQEKGCPCCGTEEETLEHILQCKDKQMSKVRDESLVTITKTLNVEGDPEQKME